MHYNFHRYYDPELGRYVQADPLGMDAGLNYHVYCGGNPVGVFDSLELLSAGELGIGKPGSYGGVNTESSMRDENPSGGGGNGSGNGNSGYVNDFQKALAGLGPHQALVTPDRVYITIGNMPSSSYGISISLTSMSLDSLASNAFNGHGGDREVSFTQPNRNISKDSLEIIESTLPYIEVAAFIGVWFPVTTVPCSIILTASTIGGLLIDGIQLYSAPPNTEVVPFV